MGVIYTESPMHQLIEQKRVEKGFVVVAACGVEVRRSVDMPEDFTGWQSLVTCKSCLNPTTTRGIT